MTSGNEMITKLRADAKEIQEKLERMRKPILELETTLNHLQGAIAFYGSQTNDKALADALNEALSSANSMPKLRGMTHEEAVIAIAKHNGGTVRTQEAKRLMIKAGIMSQTKNSTNMAHNAIKRTDMFERVSPGEYRLKPELQTKTRTVELLPLRPPVN